ncbi:cytochrome P450 [Nocardiopsis sp. EMB25]|uniref:cytochrome P450 n=1 Tax=Nocardiopsis sp. EMB25 TaxID=2835867 RepID=UPI002284C520|nr:cytochrome P450 [Nocardiopsis sp. EMB25]MCY9786933.1 cytochrome P450 [Nocardiopsis sp. EMB25]
MTTIRTDGDDPHQPSPHCPHQLTRLYGSLPDRGLDGLWERLRECHGAVAPAELEDGVRVWVLLGYHENLTVLRNQRLFSRDTRRWREVVEGRVDLATSRPTLSWRPNALYTDGAAHTRLRAPIVDALSRVDLATTERVVRRIADDLVDAFVARGRADLITEFAAPLPVLVVNRLYGLSDSYGHMLGDLTSIVFGEDAKRGADAVSRIQQYFAGLVVRKRERPGEDLVSWMLAHPSGLSDHEVAHQAALINNASHQPTTHLIGNTMRTLLTNPGLRQAQADACVSVQDLLDHVMWTDMPFQLIAARFALHDVRIGDADVRAGDALLIGFAPAHRDPAVRPDPRHGTAGVVSGNRAHLMFGAGPHACPARELARMITAVAVRTLNERLTGLHLAVPPEELRAVPSVFVRGLRELPVAFVPGEPSRRTAPETTEPQCGPRLPQPRPEPDEGHREPDLLDRLLSWWRGPRQRD